MPSMGAQVPGQLGRGQSDTGCYFLFPQLSPKGASKEDTLVTCCVLHVGAGSLGTEKELGFSSADADLLSTLLVQALMSSN